MEDIKHNPKAYESVWKNNGDVYFRGNDAIFVQSDYVSGFSQLLYYPKSTLSENDGYTKEQVIDNNILNGWELKIFENELNLACEGDKITINNRQRLESNKKPSDYFDTINNNPIYKYETGITPEDWLTLFVVHLEQTDQVIDDPVGYGNMSFLLGCRIIFDKGYDPQYHIAGWYRNHDLQQVELYGNVGDVADPWHNCRTSINLK